MNLELPNPPLPPLTAAEYADGSGFAYRGVPIVEDEDGCYVYAFGHVPPKKFVKVVRDFDREMGCYDTEPYEPEDVKHVWSVTLRGPDHPDGWLVTWHEITEETPGAFPMTVVDR